MAARSKDRGLVGSDEAFLAALLTAFADAFLAELFGE
jgi:hypothetical protein